MRKCIISTAALRKSSDDHEIILANTIVMPGLALSRSRGVQLFRTALDMNGLILLRLSPYLILIYVLNSKELLWWSVKPPIKINTYQKISRQDFESET